MTISISLVIMVHSMHIAIMLIVVDQHLAKQQNRSGKRKRTHYNAGLFQSQTSNYILLNFSIQYAYK